MELWAAIDLMGGSAVTLVQGRAEARTVWRETPLEVARRWQDEGADGIHVVDLDAALGTGSNTGVVRRIVEEARVPVQVGGGIRSAAAAESWLADGAARVVLGTLVFSDPAAARGVLERRGPERVVVAADYREAGRVVVTRGWTESREMEVLACARDLEARGFRNLLTTAVGRDGTARGPDVETVEELSRATGMRIAASGGIRDTRDLLALERAGASSAVIGRALYEETVTLGDAKGRMTA